MENLSVIPILVSFLGASLGAYFAIVKSKREKLWQERYETLKELVFSASAITSSFTVFHMEGMGVSVASDSEIEQLKHELAEAKINLRKNIAKLQLLFDRHDCELVLDAHVELNSAILELKNLNAGDYVPEYQEQVSNKAELLLQAVINLAQLKCL